MRVFGIEPNGKFNEYLRTPFNAEHEEAILESWMENNPDKIVEKGNLLLIGRQVTTNLGTFIDLLGIDRQGDLVVVELKRDRTPRDTLAQSLEYASFVEQLDTEQLEEILRSYLKDDSINLAEYHREYYELGSDEAVSFNKDQHIVIVGQSVTKEIRQTSSFLRSKGIRVTCVEFSFFVEPDGKKRLLSQNIVVGHEAEKPIHVSTGSLPLTSEGEFLKVVDENGKQIFECLLAFAESKSMPIHWGTKGFSLNTDIEGNHVTVCYGYPPETVFKQSIYTAIHGWGGVERKTNLSEVAINSLFSQAQQTGLFQAAGTELKCVINRAFSEDEVKNLFSWIENVNKIILEAGLRE